MGEQILIIEDDQELGPEMKGQLEASGFTVELRTSVTLPLEGLEQFSLVVLDLMLPETYGLDVLKFIRSMGDVPVLIVSARNDSQDVVRALKLGADDYLRKPFWPNELQARVLARLRRPTMQRLQMIRLHGLEIDVDGRSVKVDGEAADLTRVEMDLLLMLARRPGAAVSRQSLCDEVLGNSEGSERTLDVHFSRLRKKIGAQRIATVWGIGYRLVP